MILAACLSEGLLVEDVARVLTGTPMILEQTDAMQCCSLLLFCRLKE